MALALTYGGTKGSNTKKLYQIVITITFFLTSVHVVLVTYCCLLCVLSNDMLNISIGKFSLKIDTPTSRPLNNLYLQITTDVTHHVWITKHQIGVCLHKTLSVISLNQIHKMLRYCKVIWH